MLGGCSGEAVLGYPPSPGPLGIFRRDDIEGPPVVDRVPPAASAPEFAAATMRLRVEISNHSFAVETPDSAASGRGARCSWGRCAGTLDRCPPRPYVLGGELAAIDGRAALMTVARAVAASVAVPV